MSEINTVPSRGTSGVSSLPLVAGVRVEERPSLDTSVCLAGKRDSLLGGVRLDALPLGAAAEALLLFGAAEALLLFGAAEALLLSGAAAAEALLLSGTLGAAAAEALAWSSIGKRLSACTCAGCAARTC